MKSAFMFQCGHASRIEFSIILRVDPKNLSLLNSRLFLLHIALNIYRNFAKTSWNATNVDDKLNSTLPHK
jgi:hypothetical protein